MKNWAKGCTLSFRFSELSFRRSTPTGTTFGRGGENPRTQSRPGQCFREYLRSEKIRWRELRAHTHARAGGDAQREMKTRRAVPNCFVAFQTRGETILKTRNQMVY